MEQVEGWMRMIIYKGRRVTKANGSGFNGGMKAREGKDGHGLRSTELDVRNAVLLDTGDLNLQLANAIVLGCFVRLA